MSHSIPFSSAVDVLCFSHLRWAFVFQRPQHLLTRCAEHHRVFYWEEPVFDADAPYLETRTSGGVTVAVPHLPRPQAGIDATDLQRDLLDAFLADEAVETYVLWYYTPMALAFTNHLQPEAVVYDCMDELTAFKDSPPALRSYEAQLLARADLVFAGGRSLYEAKRETNPNVHAFPSSVDAAHFAKARLPMADPPDQAHIGRPRLGFFGVIDERLDVDLIAGVAAARPDWQLIMVGPIVKIDPGILPASPNIHYLGAKDYQSLPSYICGWDVALLPFARNEATRFISPTKTPEYMAAGKPVVSTSIRDVVDPYGRTGLARIADSVEDFVAACESALHENAEERIRRGDVFLKQTSWNGTWAGMRQLLEATLGSSLTTAAHAAQAR